MTGREEVARDCPNCAAGRIAVVECDCCGWTEGDALRDYSYRSRGRWSATAIERGEHLDRKP